MSTNIKDKFKTIHPRYAVDNIGTDYVKNQIKGPSKSQYVYNDEAEDFFPSNELSKQF